MYGIVLEEDLAQVAQLYATDFKEHILVHRGLLTDVSYLAQRIKSESEVWAIAKQRERVVGIAALALTSVIGLGEIERVCVDAAHRGNGVAYSLCEFLVEEARKRGYGFVEAFARGNQPPMQRTFEKLGFRVYGVSPRFEIIHEGRIMREQFVHMGIELRPETVYQDGLDLIPAAERVYKFIHGKEEHKY